MFARSIFLRESIAVSIDSRPSKPTIPATTTSTFFGSVAALIPSFPVRTLVLIFFISSFAEIGSFITTTSGENSVTNLSISVKFLLATKEYILYLSGHVRTISRVLFPIDPVAPRRETHFISGLLVRLKPVKEI